MPPGCGRVRNRPRHAVGPAPEHRALAWYPTCMRITPTLAGLAASILCAAATPAEPPTLADYNVTWSTPGPDASASMPIGNGELGLNVWTEPTGDIVMYLARTDSWSEASRLMKLARVRVTFDPPLVQPGRAFTQQLDLGAGVIHIRSMVPSDEANVRIVVHPDQQVAYVAGTFDTPRTIKIALEVWRNERKQLSGSGPDAELTSSWTMHDSPHPVWESADVIVPDPAHIVWYHRNEDSVTPLSIEHQGLKGIAASVPDVLTHRTFGGTISALPGDAFRKTGSTLFESNGPREWFEARIVAHAEQTDTPDAWLEHVRTLTGAADDAKTALARAEQWWGDFWNRSYIFVDGDTAAGIPANAHPITLGQDSSAGNRFRGEIHRAGMYGKALNDAEIQRLMRGTKEQPPAFPHDRVLSFVSTDQPGKTAPDSAVMQFPSGFTAEAWIKPDADLQAARILDKVTPGAADGFLFDIQPGGTLRLIVGDRELSAPGALKLGVWSRVAATFDPKVDQLRLFVESRQVAASARDENNAAPSKITRGYILQRWMQACAGRGNAPIKFNGSIFTVDARFSGGPKEISPDYRRWGDCFWWQNTRLPYHPMLAAGDYDLMEPLFHLYTTVLPLSEQRAHAYYNARGAYFPETMTVTGLYSNGDYGWNREGHAPGDILCPWWQYAWNQGPELVALMLDRYAYTQDEAFARDQLLPMARAVLSYFDSRFARSQGGTLQIAPTQALETYWHDVINDMPCVAGLHDVTSRLLALPPTLGDETDRQLWRRLADALPPLPTRQVDGVAMYAPAEKFKDQRSNCETPELALVFPHRLIGLASTPEQIEMARAAYRHRHDKATHGWTQDGQFAALLGLTDEAKANILAKARNSNPRHKFPAIWGPNFDWLPDQCHGGNLMHVLQCMLLQPIGDKLYVLPAWPKEWNVRFKLHAPKDTTVECEYRDGKVVELKVTPEGRRGDVLLPQ